jgi:hypothetical protein
MIPAPITAIRSRSFAPAMAEYPRAVTNDAAPIAPTNSLRDMEKLMQRL